MSTSPERDTRHFDEGRRFPRVEAEMMAVIHDHETRHFCHVRDLSEGGMRLMGKDVPGDVTYLDVDLHLPDNLAPLRVVARRVHRRTGGFGMRFVKLAPGGRTRLGRYVRDRLQRYPVRDRRLELEQKLVLLPRGAAAAYGGDRTDRVDVPPLGGVAPDLDETEKHEVATFVPPPRPARPVAPASPSMISASSAFSPKVYEPSAGRLRPALPVPQDAVAPPSSIVPPPLRVARPLVAAPPPRPAPPPRADPSAGLVTRALYNGSAAAAAAAAAAARREATPTSAAPRLHAQEIAERRKPALPIPPRARPLVS